MSETNQNENKTVNTNKKDISEFRDMPEDNYVYNSTSDEPSRLSKAFWIGVVALCIMIALAGFMTVTQLILSNSTTKSTEETEEIVEEQPCEDELDIISTEVLKPVIYCYNSNSNVEVSLDVNNGELYCEYPKHTQITENTYIWNVRVTEDGTIYTENNEEYSYIFWEALGNTEEYNFDDGVGYCIKGENTENFLRETLSNIGLTPKEYNEFIVYWLPLMQKNEYNLIKFYGLDKNDIYNKDYTLTVKEDNNIINNQLRVFMIWKSSDSEITLEPQNFTNVEFDRYNGTAIVEWGGSEIH